MLSLLLLSLSLVGKTIAQNVSTAQDATVFALTYGYPLLAYERIRLEPIKNKWIHFRQLQGPTSVAVVKPNVDTLYSALCYDLSNADLVVSIPDGIPSSQFALLSFFDPFGTNYANIGTANFNEPGKYRVRPRAAESTGSVTPTNSSSSEYKASIESPSLYGFVLIRWLVNNTNLDALHRWQDATVNATISVPQRGPDLFSLPRQDKNRTPADNVLSLLTAFAPYTLPTDSTEAERVLSTLRQAGISNGTYTAPQGVDLVAANQTAVNLTTASAAASNARTELSNGWTAANSSLIGIYDTNYAFRSAVADGGYLAIRAPNAIYPSWSNGSSNTPLGGSFTLGASEAIIFTFSSTPPLISTGFWSLTAYQNNFLIDNPYNIYAVTSERSNITYPNGSLVYARNSSTTASANQTYQILVQPANIAPPTNWTSNFLPGPAGGGLIQITLRLYGAQQSLLDGDWQYPVVTRVAAISNGSTPTNSSSKPSSTAPATSTSSAPAVSTGLAYRTGAQLGTVGLTAIVVAALSL